MDIIATFSEELACIESSEAEAFKSFINDKGFDGMSEELLVALIKQMGFEDFIAYSGDIFVHGANNGTGGFIYHDELSEFFYKNKASIITSLRQLADFYDKNSGIGLVADFKAMAKNKINADEIADVIYSDTPTSDNKSFIIDTICWFCLEELCHLYIKYQQAALSKP